MILLLLQTIAYTVSQKSKPLDVTLSNVDRFSKFFHHVIRTKTIHIRNTQQKDFTLQRFPLHLQYVATLRCEIRKSKNVIEFSS